MDLNIPLDFHTIETTISAVVGSGATAALLTWRKMLHDRNAAKLELTRTNAEIDVVEHLQDQRDYAMGEAKESKRTQIHSEYESQNSKAKITALEFELSTLRARVQLLSQLVTRLTTALDLTRNQLNGIIRKTQGVDEPLTSP